MSFAFIVRLSFFIPITNRMERAGHVLREFGERKAVPGRLNAVAGKPRGKPIVQMTMTSMPES